LLEVDEGLVDQASSGLVSRQSRQLIGCFGS